MSFVSRLRMANMFPVNSDLGDASIRIDGDEIDNIIARVRDLSLNNPMQRPVGMQMVSGMGRQSTIPQPMKFGGVFDSGPNPGAEMNARAGQDVRDIYESYKRPLNPQVNGPSNDEIYAKEYFDRQNKEKLANAALNNSGNKGWETATVTDPNDPNKQTSVRVNKQTGEVQPIAGLPSGGVITNKDNPAAIQRRVDAENQRKTQRDAIVGKATDSLNLLNQLLDPNTNELTSEASRAVGKSSIGNWIPTTSGYSGSLKIQRLAKERVLDLIGEMKAQSKTGATGFGQMNLRELAVLEKAASMLDTGLDEDTFKEQLKEIKNKLNSILTEPTNIKLVSSHEQNAPQSPHPDYEYVRNATNTGWTAVKKGGK